MQTIFSDDLLIAAARRGISELLSTTQGRKIFGKKAVMLDTDNGFRIVPCSGYTEYSVRLGVRAMPGAM